MMQVTQGAPSDAFFEGDAVSDCGVDRGGDESAGGGRGVWCERGEGVIGGWGSLWR